MLLTLQSPWAGIKSLQPSYLLQRDLPCLKGNGSASERVKIVKGSIPEPFIGNPNTASVVLLGLNPGHSEEDQWHYKHNQSFREAIFANLRHEPKMEYPFYPLNPKFIDTPVARWWRQRTRALREAVGVDDKQISRRLMAVEWFPYHSSNFDAAKHSCDSQEYLHNLVALLNQHGRLIVGLRGRRLWDQKIDGIRYLNSAQCSYVSPGNMDPRLFEEMKTKLRTDLDA